MSAAAENANAAPMDNQAIKRQSQFTIYHGFALSLALHAVVVLPIAARQLIPVQQSSEPLVLDFEDVEINERQVDEKVLEQTKGQDVQEEKPAEKPKEAPSPEQQQQPQQAVAPVQESPQEIVTEDMDASPPPPPPQPQQEEKKAVEEKPVEKTTAPPVEETTANSGTENKKGADTQQKAETVKPIERAQIQAYSVLLSKKIRAHLVYPDEGRQSGLQGVPKVSFTILSDGQLRPDSLKLVKSSGQAKLDASALQTIRASAPFDPPPMEIPVVMDVNFFKEREK